YSYIQRNLETPDELNRKADDTLIVFVPGSHPLKLKKAYYTHIPEIKALMESASLSNIFEFQREDDDYSEFIPQEALALLEKEESQQQEEPQEENKEKRQENEEALPYWD
ncbi:type IV secretory system conjugative DNA transfer family protein, partial [Fictibacillus sp. Mic-4]